MSAKTDNFRANYTAATEYGLTCLHHDACLLALLEVGLPAVLRELALADEATKQRSGKLETTEAINKTAGRPSPNSTHF
jgi:hypothetical protein